MSIVTSPLRVYGIILNVAPVSKQRHPCLEIVYIGAAGLIAQNGDQLIMGKRKSIATPTHTPNPYDGSDLDAKQRIHFEKESVIKAIQRRQCAPHLTPHLSTHDKHPSNARVGHKGENAARTIVRTSSVRDGYRSLLHELRQGKGEIATAMPFLCGALPPRPRRFRS